LAGVLSLAALPNFHAVSVATILSIA